MVIDSCQKRYLMDMQLIYYLAKPFRPKKIKKKQPDFDWYFLFSK